MSGILLREVLHLEGEKPALFYDILLGETVVGSCSLRLWQDEEMRYGGNIGFFIDEAFRGHHYAVEACHVLFSIAERYGMHQVYLTCSVGNNASRRTCELAGCAFLGEEKIPEGSELYAQGEHRQWTFVKYLF